MVILAFLLLSIIMTIEVFVAYNRIYSINNDSYVEGLTLNSAIALITRVFTFMCIPIFAYYADTRDFTSDHHDLIIGFLFIPVSICLCPIIFIRYGNFLGLFLNRIKGGSYFSKNDKSEVNPQSFINFQWAFSFNNLNQHKKGTYYIILISYILYYVTWPSVLLLAAYFHEYRTTIFSLNTLFTALNTIIMTLFVDPKVTYLAAKSKHRSIEYLWVLINIRQIASIIAYLFMVIFIVILS